MYALAPHQFSSVVCQSPLVTDLHSLTIRDHLKGVSKLLGSMETNEQRHSPRRGPVFRWFKSRRQRGSVESLTSFLRLRSYIFDLVALDLHLRPPQGPSQKLLLGLIYGNEQRQASGRGGTSVVVDLDVGRLFKFY
ncbi:hypothetical protein EDB89DRAFT_1914006 [Lactarius sanguifluus]|nr:hypothetical protein EDB89DRAFT_1914006 [Lactarius sanguifluus]